MLEFELEFIPKISYVMYQNNMDAAVKVQAFNDGEDLSAVSFMIRSEPVFFKEFECRYDGIAAGATVDLKEHPSFKVQLDAGHIVSLTERENARVVMTARSGEEVLCESSCECTVLPFDDWPGNESPELIASFVTPNASCMPMIHADAADVLEGWGKAPSLEGYQGDNNRVLLMGAAIFAALQGYNITYVNPPAGFEEKGQRIRIPDAVMSDREGTCIDLAVLYASALESIRVHPLIFLVKGHAFAGFWLSDHCLSEYLGYDTAMITRLIRGDEMRAVECTNLTRSGLSSFEDACDSALKRLEKGGDDFICVLDVYRSRTVFTPLPVRKQVNGEWTVEQDTVDVVSEPPRATNVYDDIESRRLTRVDRWKRDLLDITNKNNLISVKAGTKVSPLMVSDISAFEDALSEGREFSFLPRPEEWTGKRDYDEWPFEPDHYMANYVEGAKVDLERKVVRLPLSEQETEMTLRGIYRAANKEMDESGCNSLFVSLGMLRWFETGTKVARYSPLILVPAAVRRKRTGFALSKLDEDPVFNVTLLEKLRQEYDMDPPNLDPLPTDDRGVNVKQLLQIVRRLIVRMDGWDVLDTAAFGVYSFNQFVLWKDLDLNIDTLRECTAVDCLIESKPYPADKELDEESDPYGLCLTMPADGSQIKAVRAARNGRTFVMHGPPGTGKSQTIANIITDALYQGKTVLFVAEKKAALDVVQKRLDKVGIGNHCLEIHSNKSQKSEVLEQLRRSLQRDESFDEAKREEVVRRIDSIRGKLDAYVSALHKQQPWGLSAYDCISRYESRNTTGARDIVVPASAVMSMKLETVPEIEDHIRNSCTAYSLVEDMDGEVMRRIGTTDIPASIGEDAREAMDAARKAADSLEAVSAEAGRLSLPVRFDDPLEMSGFLVKIASVNPGMAIDPELDALPAVLKEVRSELRSAMSFFADKTSMGVRMPTLLAEDGLSQLDRLDGRFKALSSKGYYRGTAILTMLDEMKDFFTMFVKVKKDADAVLGTWTPKVFDLNPQWNVSANWREADSAGFFKKSKMKKDFLDRVAHCLRDPNTRFEDLSSTVNLIDGIAEEMVRMEAIRTRYAGEPQDVHNEVVAMDSVAMLAGTAIDAIASTGIPFDQFPSVYAKVSSSDGLAERFAAAGKDWVDAIGGLDRVLGFTSPVSTPEQFRSFDEGVSPYMDRLFDWVSWNVYAGRLEDAGLESAVDLIRSGTDPDVLVDSVYRSLYKTMITICRQESEALRIFNADNFEDLVSKFKNLDLAYTNFNQSLLRFRLSQNIPRNMDTSVNGTEAGILYKAVNSKTMRKSIRTLLSEIPNILPRICPCLLMSPQSVAQYLTMDYPRFDLVIFDESSQITTCKAVGALGRARCAVIAGDSRQLPPTTFFQKQIDASDDDDDDMVDIESFLDDCLALNMPETYLEWHYRSKHESLITFSNRMFYDNKMLTFPSPNDRETKVSLRKVESVYERGKRVNVGEAAAIVEEVRRRLMDPALGGQTIGIVAFSINQQECIQNMLDDRLARDNAFYSRYNMMEEELFVKNLETVQGDERDVILFSIGYGPGSDGTVYQNFGPINRAGGSKRLNVAVSRSKMEMVVFTSMRYTDIRITATSSDGVRSLREFLRFAENGGRFGERESRRIFGSGSKVIANLADALEKHGYQTAKGVGTSDFKVDLGVVDPDNPGVYLLGILNDGDSYRHSGNTRDREYARADVLGRLGWNLMRVWSIDWYYNKRKTVKAVLDRLEELKRERPCPAPEAEPAEVEAPDAEPGAEAPEDAPPDAPAQDGRRRTYREAVVEGEYGPDSVYNDAAVHAAALSVLSQESPVCEEWMVRQLCTAFGVDRITRSVRDTLTRKLRGIFDPQASDDGGVVYWSPGEFPDGFDIYRVPETGRRDLEHIPMVEIVNALDDMVRESGSLMEESVPLAVARVFGYTRSGSKVKAVTDVALKLAIDRGLVADVEGRILSGDSL